MSKWDKLCCGMPYLDIKGLYEWLTKVFNYTEALQCKLDAIKEVMKTMCEDVDCDLFNEDKAEWCVGCPIFGLEKILEESDAEKEEDS